MCTTKGRSPPSEPNSESEIVFRIGRTTLLGQIIQIIINRNLKSEIMKTTVITSGKENGSVKNASADKLAIRQSVPLKDNLTQSDKDKVNEEVPNSAPTKLEIKEQLREVKPAMNLESTIKLALDLNRRINQRGKLLETIGAFEAFEVAQKDDAEETDTTHFQGCELTIEDDKGREFNTKNPFIINAVAKMVNTLCVDKLAEIEGEIFIPVK